MMQQLANEASYQVNYGNANQQEWNYASKRSLNDQAMFHGSDLITQQKDLSYLKEIMNKIITPLQIDFEKLKEQLTPSQNKIINDYRDEITKTFKDHPEQLTNKLNELDSKIPDIVSGKIKLPEAEPETKIDKGRGR